MCEKHWSVACCMPLTRDWAPTCEWNQRPFGLQDDAQPTEPHQPGLDKIDFWKLSTNTLSQVATRGFPPLAMPKSLAPSLRFLYRCIKLVFHSVVFVHDTLALRRGDDLGHCSCWTLSHMDSVSLYIPTLALSTTGFVPRVSRWESCAWHFWGFSSAILKCT